MAVKYAVKTGNWSDPTTWDNGVIPSAGDDVYSNGFTVTIDQNVATLSSLRNTSRGRTVATPVMSGFSNSIGVVTQSANWAGSYGWMMFDQNGGSTTWDMSTGTGWVAFEWYNNVTKRITAYYFLGNATSWQFQAWDGTAYVTLHSVTGGTATSGFVSPEFTNPNSYSKYRFNITASTANTQSEFSMYEFGTANISAGGSFSLGGGVTADVGDVVCNTSPAVLTFSSTGTSTLTTKSLCGLSTSGTGTLNLNTTGTVYPNVNGGLFYQYAMNINSKVIANIYGNINNGGATSYYGCIINNANAVINITGNLTGYIGANYTGGCVSLAAGTVNIVGNLAGGNFYTTTSHAYAVYITGTSTLNVTGTLTTPSSAQAIYVNAGNPTINISGTLTPSSQTIIALATASTVTITSPLTAGSTQILNSNVGGTLNVTGAITASSTSPAIISSNGGATNIFTGPFISNNNVMAVVAAKMFVTNTPTYWRFQSDARTMYTADYNPDYPSTLNVRSGTTYGSGMTGTMIVPPASSVTSGVPVGNTVGTSANTVTAVQDAVWGKLTSTMTTSGSIGERVKNALTQDTLGNLLTSL